MSTPTNVLPGSHRKVRPSGGYRRTASFQAATLIYDATVYFCEKFIDPRSRTVDQMVQAARSGRQNIAEGSRAAATSSQTELRLVNVARASLEELLLDYEDYLRHRRLPQWAPDSAEAQAVRHAAPRTRMPAAPEQPDSAEEAERSDAERWALYARWLEHADAAVRANALICVIHQANYLLDRQIAALEATFVHEGGYSEQLATARLKQRGQRGESDSPPRPGQTGPADRPSGDSPPKPAAPPSCPQCGALMALRTAKAGKTPGGQFWGCTRYPECKGTVAIA